MFAWLFLSRQLPTCFGSKAFFVLSDDPLSRPVSLSGEKLFHFVNCNREVESLSVALVEGVNPDQGAGIGN